jgi:Domain of unknown function (DUF6766)
VRFIRENSLSLFFLALLLLTLLGQSLVGHSVYNEEAVQHSEQTISYARYLVSPRFGEAVMENWESEFLQFTLYILATVWLVQKGSPESKKLEEAGLGSEEEALVGRHAREDSPAWSRAGGLRTAIYSHSLVLLMGLLFIGAWLGHSVTGWREFNEEQAAHGDPALSWSTYLGKPDFWEQSFQNWQSEFLAIGAMVMFSIYLRQRGSPESKPVGAPHTQTGRTN